MRILAILVGVFIANALFCKMYCCMEKKHSEKTTGNSGKSTKNTIEPQRVSKKKQFVRKIRIALESWLRLNLFVISYFPSHYVRKFFYKYICYMEIGENVVIYYGTEIRAPWNISIEEGTIIGDKCVLDGRYGIQIGKNVNFSTGAWLWTLQHDVQDSNFGIKNQGKKIVIHDRAWLSNRIIVLPGTEIGEGAVVAAGAVVTKSLESYTIYGGVPAKKIGDRNQNLTYMFDGSHMLFL